MPSQPKPEWFLAPRNVPPDTTITLGKLLTSPRNPGGPPYLRAVTIFSSSSSSAATDNDDDKPTPTPIRTTRHPYKRTTSTAHGYKVGVFASFLTNILGVGADLSTDISTSHSTSVTVDTLETSTFEPNKEYLSRLLNDQHNLSELFASSLSSSSSSRRLVSSSKFRKLYVITGVQVARGGVIHSRRTRSHATEGQVSIDPVAVGAGIPGTGLVEVGPTLGVSQSREDDETVGKHDFVYAFKINKVAYRRRQQQQQEVSGDGEIVPGQQERVTRGAAFGEGRRYGGDGDDDDDDETNGRRIEGCEVLGVDMRSAGMNEFGVRGDEVGEDGAGEGDVEVCVVIDPSKIEEDDDEDEDEDDDD